METKLYLLIALLAQLTLGAKKTCRSSLSEPNPFADDPVNKHFPLTGTVNGTVAILPIPYDLARRIIPAKWPILTKQYQQWLPWLPHDHYPAVLQTSLDHDVRAYGKGAPDFQHTGISFPFVDRLNDGYTAMMFNDKILISEDASFVFSAFEAFGYKVTPAIFEPICEAYYYAIGQIDPHTYHWDDLPDGTIYSKVYAHKKPKRPAPKRPAIDWIMEPIHESPVPIDFWYNITNQPLMSYNESQCDHFARLLNTPVSQGKYAPQALRGCVNAKRPFFPVDWSWENVWGIKMDQAFKESGPVPCESLKGLSVVTAH